MNTNDIPTPIADAKELELAKLGAKEMFLWSPLVRQLERKLAVANRDNAVLLERLAERTRDYTTHAASELDKLRAAEKVIAVKNDALRLVSEWNLPESTYNDWTRVHKGEQEKPDVCPCSYETAHGSNGARDYIKGISRKALELS